MSQPVSEEEIITTYELLERSASAALEFQREDGSFPPGDNYQYNDKSTPIRTTAHWLTTISEAYRITSDNKLRKAATMALDYLLSDDCRPNGYTFECRKSRKKDHCNGLIGQAYPICALTHAGHILNRPDAINLASELYDLHIFDQDIKLWKAIEITGDSLSFDRTLNHQITFAASCIGLIDDHKPVESDLRDFLTGLKHNLRTNDRGLIHHFVRPRPSMTIKSIFKKDPSYFTLLRNEVLFHYHVRSASHHYKEIGYHSVNLQQLALLKRKFPNHSLWEMNSIVDAVDYLCSSEYQSIQHEAVMGTTIPGIREAWIEIEFNNVDPNNASHHIERDLDRLLNNKTFLLTSDSVNKIDQSSSISFLVGYPNVKINFSDSESA